MGGGPEVRGVLDGSGGTAARGDPSFPEQQLVPLGPTLGLVDVATRRAIATVVSRQLGAERGLEGRRFVFTGESAGLDRGCAVAMVRRLGGIVQKQVSPAMLSHMVPQCTRPHKKKPPGEGETFSGKCARAAPSEHEARERLGTSRGRGSIAP